MELVTRLVLLSWRFHVVAAILVPLELTIPSPQFPLSFSASSPIIDGSSLLAVMENNSQYFLSGFQKDQVVRVLDANTIKLKKNGIVSLAGVRMPTPGTSNFQFPECLSYTPAYKLRQLLPAKTDVLIKIGSLTSTGKAAQAIVVKTEDSVLVNRELVRTGFGRVQKVTSSDLDKYLDTDDFQHLQARAKEDGIGIFKRCEVDERNGFFEAQFEPLELTVETQWGDDGGKLVLRQKETKAAQPNNPGDIKGCSDFSTYEDALRWYEIYFPYYGDVAKLDRNGDGVPCPGLPHTKLNAQYRMKVPSNVKE